VQGRVLVAGRARKSQTSTEPTESPSRITVSIYQDPEHIEGILQQTNRGLLTDSSHADEATDTETHTRDTDVGAQVEVTTRIPVIGGVGGAGNVARTTGSSDVRLSGRRGTRNFKYTSAYYLHHVRQTLSQRGLLRTVTSGDEVGTLRVGDFVEFEASFSPDELISLLDVFNPELIAALTRWTRRRSLLKEISDASPEDREGLAIQYQYRPDVDAEAAKAVAEAIRVDFRSNATRQYYGIIGESGPTAVVVCDTRNFLVEDTDRMLDGEFTVLGKVSTRPERDVPIFSRNKVLDRIQPEAVDLIVQQLRALASSPIEGGAAFFGNEATFDDMIDLNFSSRIDGGSFKLLPIAIYV
jgi:hypothetical protein